MRVVQLTQFGSEHLQFTEVPTPTPGPHEVLVRLEAVALNYQDAFLVSGAYLPNLPLPHVPTSDGAGVVAAVGAGVRSWQPGDRVMVHFFQRWLGGPPTPEALAVATGLTTPGMLADYAVLPATALVRIPDYLSAAEAATLPIAGLTAWAGLVEHGGLRPGHTVLTQGTGGVSLAALQAGQLVVIATSSSDDKLARLRALGADVVVNYRTHPDWVGEVRRLTGGQGVDITLDVASGAALADLVRAVRLHGVVPFVGVQAGAQASLDLFPACAPSCACKGLWSAAGHRSSSTSRPWPSTRCARWSTASLRSARRRKRFGTWRVASMLARWSSGCN